MAVKWIGFPGVILVIFTTKQVELWAPTRKLVFGPTLYMAPISGDLYWEIFFGAPCGSWVWIIQMRKFAKQKSQFSENMCTKTFIWRHLKMFLDLVCLKKSVMLFYYNWFRLHPRSKSENLGCFWGSWFLFSADFPVKECCLVWFQLAFAAGAMLLFAFPYIHIGAKLGFGKILGRKFDFWKMFGGLQVCLCSFLMMDVHICFIFRPIWARLPSWPRFFQMGWYGRTLGIVPLTINPIYTEK